MIFIVIFNIVLYAIVFFWTYRNMYALENKTKIIYNLSMLIFLYIITKLLYNIGGNPIDEKFGEAAITFNRTMTSIFIGLNGLMIMPHIGMALNKYKEEIIDIKGLNKRLVIISVIFILFMIFEFNYMKDMQTNMLEIIKQR